MSHVYERMSKVQTTNPYFKKDLQKAVNATKFIGRGSMASSTHRYMTAIGNLANCGEYNENDVVFVSAEGMRKGREDIDFEELVLAIKSKVTFITDTAVDRERPYNQGERQVAAFFNKNNYYEVTPGKWKSKE